MRVSPALKRLHRGVLVGALHAAMHEADALAENARQILEAILGGGEIEVLVLLDQRAHPIGARAALPARAASPSTTSPMRDCGSARVLMGVRPGGFSSSTELSMSPKQRERQRARNRRRGHDQHIRRLALGAERQSLLHAETMLLVDDREAEIVEGEIA